MPATQLATSYDNSQVFLGKNHFDTASYTNSSGGAVVLTEGRLMGRVLADNKVQPQVSSATDGSEFPRMICADNVTVADGATVTLNICTKGRINQNKITFGGADTLATAIRLVATGGMTIKDCLNAMSFELEPTTELSRVDPNI